jgi:ribosome-binding protein aMBF1 (putative translation factor)
MEFDDDYLDSAFEQEMMAIFGLDDEVFPGGVERTGPLPQHVVDRLHKQGKETPDEYRARRNAAFRSHQELLIKNGAKKETREMDKELPPVEKPTKDFCVLLQQASLARGLKQKDLAAKLNIKVNDLQSYESGKVKIPEAILRKMRRLLNF